MKTINVFPISTKVNIGTDDNKIEAVISSVMIRTEGNEITYECFWWDGRQKHSEWFYPYEITEIKKGDKKGKIGFLTKQTNDSGV